MENHDGLEIQPLLENHPVIQGERTHDVFDQSLLSVSLCNTCLPGDSDQDMTTLESVHSEVVEGWSAVFSPYRVQPGSYHTT